jgi:hypothetical protein
MEHVDQNKYYRDTVFDGRLYLVNETFDTIQKEK